MKTNIYNKSIDLLEVNILICECVIKTGKEPKYLIMNSITERMLEDPRHFYTPLGLLLESLLKKRPSGDSLITKELFGINVAICNALEDGEVEAVMDISK